MRRLVECAGAGLDHHPGGGQDYRPQRLRRRRGGLRIELAAREKPVRSRRGSVQVSAAPVRPRPEFDELHRLQDHQQRRRLWKGRQERQQLWHRKLIHRQMRLHELQRRCGSKGHGDLEAGRLLRRAFDPRGRRPARPGLLPGPGRASPSAGECVALGDGSSRSYCPAPTPCSTFKAALRSRSAQ